MKKIIWLIIPMFLLIGCTPKTVLIHVPLKRESVQKDIKKLNAQEKQDSESAGKKQREEQLTQLDKAYSNALSEAQDKLVTLKKRADRRSGVNLGINLAGIAAGITAGVLLVASPANAVWAAAFTGFGTGVLSFQTQLIDEGYSRDSIAHIHQETMDKMAAASEQFAIHYKSLQAGKDKFDIQGIQEWNNHLALADDAIIKMNVATIFTPLSVGTTDDIEKLKKANADLKKRLDDIDAKIPKK
jgi:hypothetical protein